MPYVTAGVAIGSVEAGTRTPIVPGQPLVGTDINVAPVYGVGLDAKLSDSYILKAEYLRSDLGSTIYFIPSQGQIGDVPVKAVNMFRAGLSRRF